MTTKSAEGKETIYKDCKGRQIKEGHILKVFHFIAARRRQKYFMYKICAVKDGRMVAMDIHELYSLGKEKAHTCCMEALPANTEIISSYGV